VSHVTHFTIFNIFTFYAKKSALHATSGGSQSVYCMISDYMSDEELVLGCVRKEPQAQERLFKTFSGRMLGLCSRYTDSIEEAEDIMQDAFVKIFQKIDTFRGNGSLEGWMKRIMVNTALDAFRKNKNFRHSIDIDTIEYTSETHQHVLESIGAKDLMKLMKTMPKGFRTVFNLYAIEGYAHKEIAEMLEITESTSKSQYSRARVYLQKLLQTEKAI
jgi:RNA polymerase sigma factor (sigma-70 family)